LIEVWGYTKVSFYFQNKFPNVLIYFRFGKQIILNIF
jgi:hypothetical protein